MDRCLVPKEDFEMIKWIRCTLGKGQVMDIVPPEMCMPVNQVAPAHQNNANILHRFYGLTPTEVIIATGCVPEDE